MRKASEKTYISKRQLELYQRERAKLTQEAVPKEFAEDEEAKKKISAPTQLGNISEEENLSADEIDSDDLGDDIAQTRQQVQQQQPQQQQFIQPQNFMMQNSSIFAPQQQMQQQPQQQMRNSRPMKQMNKKSAPQQNLQLSNNQQMMPPQPQNMMFSNYSQPQQQQLPQQPQQMMAGANPYMHPSMMQIPHFTPFQQPPQFPPHFQGGGQPKQDNPYLRQQMPQSNNKYKQKVDTNVFQLSMSCLSEKFEIATGDPVYCTGCQAIMNKYSTYVQSASQTWNCEFCNKANPIQIEAEEVPKTETVSYILEAAPVKEAQVTKDGGAVEESKKPDTSLPTDISIVYCIDISGSMNGYRLEAVKKTIRAQIKEMKEIYPDRKVGLVTFSDDIKVIGDGTKDTITTDRKFNGDYDFLLKNGRTIASTSFDRPIKETFNSLDQKVAQMKTEGSTALGPGLLTAIALAGEGTLGSQVIVCTDGQSNAGLGSVQHYMQSNKDPQGECELFYTQLGIYAKEKGVTVHIVTIKGSECNIDAISPVCEATNGEIERVDASDIQKNFGAFLSRQVIATKVQLKVKLHKGLEFRNEPSINLSADRTVLNKDFGNVFEDTDLTFEYQLKSVKDLLKMIDLDITKITHFPFQAQIHYTALDGSKQVRVITQRLLISSDKEALKKDADFEILGMNAVMQANKHARQGDYKMAQVISKAWDNNLNNDFTIQKSAIQQVQAQNFRSNIQSSYNMIYHQQVQMAQQPQQMFQSKKGQVSDAMSQNLYSNMRMNKAKFSNNNNMP